MPKKDEAERLLREIEELRSRILSLEESGETGKDTPASIAEAFPDIPESPASPINDAEMQDSEQTSRALLNATADSAVLIDKNGVVIDANENMAVSLGTTRNALIGSIIHSYFSPDIGEKRKAKERQAAREKKLIRFVDYRDRRWLENSVCPVFDSTGNLVRFAIFSRDITSYMVVEHALKRERDRAKAYLDLAEVIIMALDTRGRIQLINRNGCSILGYEAEQLLGKAFIEEFVPEEFREEIITVFNQIIREESPLLEYKESPIMTRDGEQRVIAWHNSVLRDEAGNITGTLSSGTDVTEQKRAENALRESEYYYRTLFESASDAIFIIERYSFIACNQKTLNMFACTHEDFIGKTPVDFSPPFQPDGQDSKNKAFRIMDDVRSGTSQFFEWRHRRFDGTLFDVEVNLAPLILKGHDRLMAVVRDITKRKQSEEALNKALAEVRQMKEAVEAENIYLHKEIRNAHLYGDIVGGSDAIRSVLSQAEQVAETDSTVLIQGETGTGKELLARAIHNMSPRKNRPLVVVNCATIPGTLVESELFGREKGAFTGAIARQVGRFEIADGSTIFLDEIGEISPDVQAKLLRVLQEGQIERLGSTRTINIDVRIIAATNRDLKKALKDDMFREDLYYRLNVFPISIPPLRDRKEDIPSLVWHFVDQMGEKMGKRIEKIPQQSIDTLTNHNWPGNIRELHNVIERAMIQTKDNILRVPSISRGVHPNKNAETLVNVEKQHILKVLAQTDWRIRGKDGAAEILDVKPTTLESRLLKLGIKRPKGNIR